MPGLELRLPASNDRFRSRSSVICHAIRRPGIRHRLRARVLGRVHCRRRIPDVHPEYVLRRNMGSLVFASLPTLLTRHVGPRFMATKAFDAHNVLFPLPASAVWTSSFAFFE